MLGGRLADAMVKAIDWGHGGYGKGAHQERARDEVWKGQFARVGQHG